MKRFLIVDDHVVLRTGIEKILLGTYKDSSVDEAGNGNEAIAKLEKHNYSLVIMDIQMPHTDTMDLVQLIHIKYKSKILMYSMNPESIYAKRYIKVGAAGFVSKDAPIEEIVKAVSLILNGRKYISDSLAESLMEKAISNTLDNPFDSLSSREFEIATLILAGKAVSEISGILNLQTSTVGTHKARMFTKLGVTNIIELKELASSYNL